MTTSRLDEIIKFISWETMTHISEQLGLNELRGIMGEFNSRLSQLEEKISWLEANYSSKNADSIELFGKLSDLVYDHKQELDQHTRIVLIQDGEEFSLYIVDPRDQDLVYDLIEEFLLKFGENVHVLTPPEFEALSEEMDVFDITDISVGEFGRD